MIILIYSLLVLLLAIAFICLYVSIKDRIKRTRKFQSDFLTNKEKGMEYNFKVVCLKCGCEDCAVLKINSEDGSATVDVHCPNCNEEYQF